MLCTNEDELDDFERYMLFHLMKLPVEERMALKQSDYCGKYSRDHYCCTLPKGHGGKHIAHTSDSKIIATWR